MTIASNNPFPSVLVVEGSAPGGPASGQQRLYIDTSDHHLKRKDHADAVTDLEAAFTGDSGSGGVKGQVPAPASGDAAAGKFLKASGAWATPSGGASIPAGTVMDYAGASVPSGWLDCDGSSVLRASYPDLFTAIGTAWGSVDGTHFTLPDLRGRTRIGVGTGSGLTARALAATGGAETHQLSTAELASHSHTISDPGHAHAEVSGNSFVENESPGSEYVSAGGDKGGTSLNTAASFTSVSAASTGSDTAHANMQPWAALHAIIKT